MGDLARKVTEALGGSSAQPDAPADKPASGYYRVRKDWSDSKSQKGAYKNLANAKKCADANPGYSVFDAEGNVVYAAAAPAPEPEAPAVPNIRTGPGSNYSKTGFFTGRGCFTILQVEKGPGSDSGWGRLKSGAGWISLDHCTKL